MTPDMFQSLDETAGIPRPFLPFQEFLTFRCRQCKRRPFMDPDHITVIDDKGFRQRLDINKIDIENKRRTANQKMINEAFKGRKKNG